MSLVELLEPIQKTWLSELIRETIWGYPITGAFHVLALALFGGATWVTDLRALGLAFRDEDPARLSAELRRWKRAGLVSVLVTGLLLFAAQPVRYSGSAAFQIKLVLLALILIHALLRRRSAWISLALWAAVIVAARGIAYF